MLNASANTFQRAPTHPGEPEKAVADLVARDFTAERRPGANWSGTPHQDVAALAAFGDGDRLLQQGGDRLCDGRSHAHRAGHPRAGDGRAQSLARSRPHYAFGPRQPNICVRIFRHARRARVAATSRPHPDMLGQCAGGIFFASLKNERSTTWCIRPGRNRGGYT